MIEVNLLRGFTADSTSAADGSGFSLNTKMSADKVVFDSKDLLGKIIFLLLPLGLVFGYEMYDEEKAKVKLTHMRKQNAILSDELSKYGKQVLEVKRIQEEKKRLDGRIKTILDLSSNRLTNAKALNALHDLVPGEAWLTSLKIKDEKVEFRGEATEDLVVSQFLRNLQESIYFQDVKLIGSEERSSATGAKKVYSIEARLGNQGGIGGK